MNILRIGSEERGSSMVEYGLLAALISLISFSAVSLAGGATEDKFTQISESLETVHTTSVGDETADESASDDLGDGQDNSSDTGQDDDSAQNDDDGNIDQQNEDDGSSEQQSADSPAPPTVEDSGSTLTKWKKNKNGGNGKWTASVEYANSTGQDQTLSLEVTTLDDKGKTKTKTIEFVVPAGSQSTFDYENNKLKVKKGETTGVLEVNVKMISVTTGEGDEAVTTEITEPESVVVEAPTP